MQGYIYKYTFPDGKVYIGQTVRPVAARHREHITPSTGKVNVGFWSAWEKFGDAKLETLLTVEGENSEELTWRLNAIEARYIREYHATDPAYGYNRVPGGHGTSASRKVFLKAFNKVFPVVWEERGAFFNDLDDLIRKSYNKPIKLNEDQAYFVKDSVIPAVIPEYRKYIKVSKSGVLKFDGGDSEHAEFYKEESFSWVLFIIRDLCDCEEEQVAQEVQEYILANSSEYLSEGVILQIDKTGNVVKEFSSITEIMHELNLSYNTNIYNVLEGKQKSAYGYVWRWKNKV